MCITFLIQNVRTNVLEKFIGCLAGHPVCIRTRRRKRRMVDEEIKEENIAKEMAAMGITLPRRQVDFFPVFVLLFEQRRLSSSATRPCTWGFKPFEQSSAFCFSSYTAPPLRLFLPFLLFFRSLVALLWLFLNPSVDLVEVFDGKMLRAKSTVCRKMKRGSSSAKKGKSTREKFHSSFVQPPLFFPSLHSYLPWMPGAVRCSAFFPVRHQHLPWTWQFHYEKQPWASQSNVLRGSCCRYYNLE